MPDKIVIIQLNEVDAHRVLSLVQQAAGGGHIWNEYWEKVANEINNCLLLQQEDGFFQCAACKEPVATP